MQAEARIGGKEETEKNSSWKADDSTEMATRENVSPEKDRQVDSVEWVI